MTDVTMLAKAARAAYAFLEKSGVYLGGYSENIRLDEDWLNEPAPIPSLTLVDGHIDLVAMSRAVLMAVREPDEAVFNRANEALFDAGEPVAHETVHAAMIDAILADGEGK